MGFRTGKNKQFFTTDIGMKDYFKVYSRNFKKKVGIKRSKILKNKYNIPYPLYSEILGKINLEVRDVLITRPYDVKLPCGFGTLCIRKKKRVAKIIDGKLLCKPPIDWNRTQEMWKNDPSTSKKVIRFENNHSNNYVFVFHWIKKNVFFKGFPCYFFRPTREGKKLLCETILNKEDYDAELMKKQKLYVKRGKKEDKENILKIQQNC